MRKDEKLIGASIERKALLAKLRRYKRVIQRNPRVQGCAYCCNNLIEWILAREKRYNEAPGGLGRKTK